MVRSGDVVVVGNNPCPIGQHAQEITFRSIVHTGSLSERLDQVKVMQTLDHLIESAGKLTIYRLSPNRGFHRLSDDTPIGDSDGPRLMESAAEPPPVACLLCSLPKQFLVQCMQTSHRTGQIDPGGVELEERSDEIFPGT